MHAQLEQAVLVQRQRRAAAVAVPRRVGLDGVVVSGDGGHPAVGDPAQQLLVGAVEHAGGLLHALVRGLPVHAQHQPGEAGVEAHDVTRLDHHPVSLQHAGQLLVADHRAAVAEVRVQIDQHRAALHGLLGHGLDAQRVRGRGAGRAGTGRPRVGRLGRPLHLAPGAKAVVVDRLGQAVAIGVEVRAYVGQAVPLRGVLQVEDGQVVADDVGAALHQVGEPKVEVDAPLPQRGPQHRRVAVGVEHVAARVVERQAQAERAAVAHLGHALAHLLGRQQVETAKLVVGPEIAPRGAGWSLHPAPGFLVRHGCLRQKDTG